MRGRFAHLYLHAPGGSDDGFPGTRPWAHALARELELRRRRGAETRRPLASILVGGPGSAAGGVSLPGAVRRIAGPESVEGVEEWTVEADPPEAGAAAVRSWAAGGVTRVNLRAGVIGDHALQRLGRPWRRADVHGAAEAVRDAGVRSLALDLLFALPSEVEPDPVEGLRRALELEPDHVSLYEWDEGPVDPDRAAGIWIALVEELRRAGFAPADLTSFARPGHRSLHGRAVLRRWPVLGLGPGARSFRNPFRVWNVPGWRGYAARLAAGREPRAGGERLDRAERTLERLWCRLRSAEGFPRRGLEALFGSLLSAWREAGWIGDDASRIRLTHEGWLRMDDLVARLALEVRRTSRPSTSRPGLEIFQGYDGQAKKGPPR